MSEKTHAELIAEQLTNIESLGDELPAVIAAGSLRKLLRHLDKAHKREVDVLNQRCAELNAEIAAKDEVIKRLDAEIRKYQEERELRIAAQKAKAAAEGYAAGKRDAQVGDCAKLREALEKILWCLKWMFDNTDDKSVQGHLGEPIALAKDAFAAPPRNCDVGTVEEQSARFRKFCMKSSMDRLEATAYCAYECPCGNNYDCKLAWAQMPYEEGGAE